MKKRFAALLFLSWLISASMAWAESPVVVSHTLAGYTMGTDSVTLSYTLKVKNTGTGGVSNVTLAYVPLMMISRDKINLTIGTLDPQVEVQVPFTITTPMLLEQAKFSGQPIFWAGTCTDSNGNLIEFPATSTQGGTP